MTISEIYNFRYTEFCENTCCDTKYEWAASEVFDLTTYDGKLDELFVKKIIEVLKVILDKANYDYIEDETNYINYIIVCQLLDGFNWIDWGTSIRGAWFDAHQRSYDKPHLILDQYETSRYINGKWKDYIYPEVRCTEENLKALIEFIESEDIEK